jgi:hypothetical protein
MLSEWFFLSVFFSLKSFTLTKSELRIKLGSCPCPEGEYIIKLATLQAIVKAAKENPSKTNLF